MAVAVLAGSQGRNGLGAASSLVPLFDLASKEVLHVIPLAPLGGGVRTGTSARFTAAHHGFTVAAKDACAIWRTKEEMQMPAPRGSVEFCDLVDEHGTVLVNAIQLVARLTGDGVVDTDESRLLEGVYLELMTSYAPIPARAMEQDNAFRCIGTLAGAGRASRKAYSLVKQAYEDTKQIA